MPEDERKRRLHRDVEPYCQGFTVTSM